MAKIQFPKEFLFGCSTASYQIEGAWDADGKGESIWDRFAHTPGKIKYGHSGDVTCDHYHRYKEDVALMKDMGIDTYRFSISWPRIFPDSSGKVNRKGVDFYSRLTDELLKAGIIPFPTLFHWDMPQWVLDKCQGWLGRDSADYFADYAAVIFQALGDRIFNWITHNEPKNVHITPGYITGTNPPEVKGGYGAGLLANHIMMLAHGKAIQACRAYQNNSEIGITLAMGAVSPLTDSQQDAEAAKKAENWDVFWNLDLLLRGKYNELATTEKMAVLMPVFESKDLEIVSTPMDFVGINHYRANWAKANDEIPTGFSFAWGEEEPCEERNGIGWPVTPGSLYDTLQLVNSRFPETKLYITENGYADATPPGTPLKLNDPERIRFLADNIADVGRALHEGIPVGGYMVWSLMDNLEWNSGFEPRFGLVAVDMETRERIPKESAQWYRAFLSHRSIDIE